MLFAGVLNLRSNSLKPGVDTNQANKEMTKDAHYHSHFEKSSPQSSEYLSKDLADLPIYMLILKRKVTLHKLCEKCVRFESS